MVVARWWVGRVWFGAGLEGGRDAAAVVIVLGFAANGLAFPNPPPELFTLPLPGPEAAAAAAATSDPMLVEVAPSPTAASPPPPPIFPPLVRRPAPPSIDPLALPPAEAVAAALAPPLVKLTLLRMSFSVLVSIPGPMLPARGPTLPDLPAAAETLPPLRLLPAGGGASELVRFRPDPVPDEPGNSAREEEMDLVREVRITEGSRSRALALTGS